MLGQVKRRKKWPPRKIEILFPFTTLNTLCLSSVWWNFEVRRRGLPECLKRSCSRVAVPHISTKGLPRRAHNSFALDRRATVLYCLFCQHLLFHSLLQQSAAVATNVPDLFFLTSFVFVSKMHHSLLLAPSFISGRTDTGIHQILLQEMMHETLLVLQLALCLCFRERALQKQGKLHFAQA